MRLLLIRHGQTPHNVDGALDTAHPGAGLTPLGQLQAEAVPGALDGEPLHGVYASPLVRTQLTATPLAQARGFRVEVRDGLEEVSAGDVEMRSDSGAVRTYADCVAAWITGDVQRRMPGGSTGADFLDRYEAAVRGIADEHGPDDTVAVFSHGAAIRIFTARAAASEPHVLADLRIMNTGMALLRGHPSSGWELERWQSAPLGGPELADDQAHDVTGESAEEAVEEA